MGVEVTVTGRPGGGLVLPGNPDYLWNMGWMSVSDGQGMLEEKRITRDSMVWLPKSMQDALSFNYALDAGVTVNVRELAPER